jgi:hypothetical protein
VHCGTLRFGYLLDVNTGNARTMPVHGEHYRHGLAVRLEEDLLKDLHDEFHGRVVVIEQHHPVPARQSGLFCIFNHSMGF